MNIRMKSLFSICRLSAVILTVIFLSFACNVPAGAESLEAKNQLSNRNITIKAFPSNSSCTPQSVGVNAQTTQTLSMICAITEVCVVIPDVSANVIGLIDISSAPSCNLTYNGSEVTKSGDTTASDGTACKFRWKSKGSPNGTKVVTCSAS